MDFILLVNRLLLAAVFLTSGLAKFADRDGSRQAMLDFGLPNLIAVPFSIILPIAEIILAISLLFVGSTWWGAVGATGLLLLFIVGIAINLARGRTPDCHCFGQLHSEPIGWPTLIRNFVLLMMAGFIVWQGPDNVGASLIGWLITLTDPQLASLFFAILVLALLVAEGWLLMHLLRQNGRLLLRIESLEAQLLPANKYQPKSIPSTPAKSEKQPGLPVGTPAPTFHLSDLRGKIISLDSLLSAGKPTLLIFSDPKCGPCLALMPKIAHWQREYARSITIAVISQGTTKNNLGKVTEHGLSKVLVQKDREISDAYRVRGTPSAILILSDGKIGSETAGGAPAINKLAEETMNAFSSNLLVKENSIRRNKTAACRLLENKNEGKHS